MHNKQLILCLIFGSSLLAEKAQMRLYKPDISLRAESQAKSAQGFKAGRGSPVIDYIVPDGKAVKKGEVVVRFNSERVKHRYDQKVNDKNSSELTYKNNIFEINNKIKDLKNEIKDHQEAIHTQEVTLETYLNLPKVEDVKLAKSNLRVAKVDYEAIKEELDKAQIRFDKGYISSVEFAEIKLSYDLKKNTLDHKQELLLVTERKADPREIRKQMIKLENNKLQYEFSRKSLSDSIKIAESKIKKQEKHLEKLDLDIEKYSERLEQLSHKAELDGYVKYANISTPIEAGSTIYWGQAVASIPDLDSTYFSAYLPENKIKHFKKGDHAKVQVSGRLDQLIDVVVTNISATPEDIAYQTKLSWGKTAKTTGVKFYLLTITPKKLPNWLRPGMTGVLHLSSEKLVEKLAIPSKFIHHRDNKTYLAYNGTMNEVSGEFQGDYFFFSQAANYQNIDFQKSAPWPKKDEDIDEQISGNSLILRGEMTAIRENTVVVPFLSDQTTISWLIPEDSKVEKGDVLAKLDATELDETILKAENQLADLEEALENAKTKMEKTHGEFEFDKKRLKNLLEYAELSRDIVLKPQLSKTLINNRYTWKSLNIQLKHSKFLYDRLKSKPSHLISNAERAKAKLAYDEALLKLQKAKVILEEEERGATSAEIAKAEIDFEIAKDNIDKTVQRMPIEIEEDKNNLKNAEIALENHRVYLSNLKTEYDSLNIKAPTKGTVHYKKLWGSNGVKKVETGTEVKSWNRILALPETDQMTVKIKVMEKFFPMIKNNVEVKITIPSINDKVFSGTLGSPGFNFDPDDEIEQSTDPYSSREPTGKVFAIYEIKLPSLANYRIKPGSVAKVEIPLEENI